MIFTYFFDGTIQCIISFCIFIWMIVGYVYYVNSRRPENDPSKRDYHPFAVVISPVTLPIYLIIAVIGFILLALFYAVFIIIFVLALIALRSSFILRWWDKFAHFVGVPLLRLNTYFIRLAFRPFMPAGSS